MRLGQNLQPDLLPTVIYLASEDAPNGVIMLVLASFQEYLFMKLWGFFARRRYDSENIQVSWTKF